MKSNDVSPYIDFSCFLTDSNNLLSINFKNKKKYDIPLLNDVISKDYSINSSKIARCKQVHSNKVLYIDNPGIYNDVDGLVTNLNTGIFLQIQTADCIPIFLYDSDTSNIGLIHSGWKGTQKEIIRRAIEIFKEKKSNSKNIKVALGPSIKSCCFEVKNDVADLFDNKYIIHKNNKLFIDLNNKIIDNLILEGIPKNSIYVSDICTYEDKNFHSFRRDGGIAGRMYSIIGGNN